MSPTPMWVMTVPVISTAHMPKSYSLKMFKDSVVAVYEGGGFLYLPDNPEHDMWTVPILNWLREVQGPDANWIRFDCDADIEEGLPVYEWSES